MSKLYVNGTLVKKDLFTNSEIEYSTEGFWNIIGSVEGAVQFFKGKIDDVRIYNISLSDKEVQKLSLAD